jgi:hypothetical protein
MGAGTLHASAYMRTSQLTVFCPNLSISLALVKYAQLQHSAEPSDVISVTPEELAAVNLNKLSENFLSIQPVLEILQLINAYHKRIISQSGSVFAERRPANDLRTRGIE